MRRVRAVALRHEFQREGGMMKRNLMRATLTVAALMSCLMPGWAGAVNGPRKDCLTVSGKTYHTIAVWFVGGEEARVALVGDGTADLDLYVYSEDGQLVASDEDATATCLARWTPPQTGRFTIKIVNCAETASDYCLATN